MLSKETYPILDVTIQGQGQVQGFGLIIFSVTIPPPHNTVRFIETYLFKYIHDVTIQGQVQGFGLIIFSVLRLIIL